MPHTAETYQDIGNSLRAAREEMGLALGDAAQQLHIRAKYLHALEEGYLNELPGVAYVRGYLQSYASFLGLDKTEIIRRFEQLDKRKKEQEFYIPEPTRKENMPTPLMLGVGAGVVLLGILLWWIFMYQPPLNVEQVSEVPDTFSDIVSERFRLTNALYACFEAEDKLAYPFCAKSHVEWPQMRHFKAPIISVVQHEEY